MRGPRPAASTTFYRNRSPRPPPSLALTTTRCTGCAFVAFDKLMTAQAVKKAFEPKHMAGYLRVLSGGLTDARAARRAVGEPAVPAARVLLRQLASCAIMLVLCMLGSAILWSTNAFLIWENDHDAFEWVKSASAGSFFAYVGIWLLSVLLIVVDHRPHRRRHRARQRPRAAAHARGQGDLGHAQDLFLPVRSPPPVTPAKS